MRDKLCIYIDGAARGNPGESGIGVVISDYKGNIIKEINRYIGVATNNIAEYTALIHALEHVDNTTASEIYIYSDSELLIKQMNGDYRVKNEKLKELFTKALCLTRKFSKVSFVHIGREQNKEADKLANKAINLACSK